METPHAACRDCGWHDLPRLRFYLIVWSQARRFREEFADVLRHRTQTSRTLDPGVRGKGFDWLEARSTGWALDQLAQRRGLQFMHPDNNEAVAKALCEGADR